MASPEIIKRIQDMPKTIRSAADLRRALGVPVGMAFELPAPYELTAGRGTGWSRAEILEWLQKGPEGRLMVTYR